MYKKNKKEKEKKEKKSIVKRKCVICILFMNVFFCMIKL
jgi:hypothetical protein